MQTAAMTLAPGQTTGVLDLFAATAGPQTFAVSGLPAGVTATETYQAPTSDYNAMEAYNFVVSKTAPDVASYPITFTSTDSSGDVGYYTLDLTIAGVCQPAPPPGAQCGTPPDGCGGTVSLGSCGTLEACDKYYECQSTAPTFPTCPKGEHCE